MIENLSKKNKILNNSVILPLLLSTIFIVILPNISRGLRFIYFVFFIFLLVHVIGVKYSKGNNSSNGAVSTEYSWFLLVIIIACFAYWEITSAWWMHDDPSILRQLIEFPIIANFYDPVTWRSYSPANFTPMLILSFWMDYQLFKLKPFGYYLHQLIVVALSGIIGFRLLRRFLFPAIAATVVIVLMVSPMVAELARSLSTRHYIDGMLFALLALIFFFRAWDEKKIAFAWMGGIFYLIASLSKEIYVPLVVLLPFFIPTRDLIRTGSIVLPFVMSALVYTLMRMNVLGLDNVLSGYGNLNSAPDESSWSLFQNHLGALGLSDLAPIVLLAALMIGGILSLMNKKKYQSLIVILVSAIIVTAPLVPLFPNFSPRYFLLPGIFVVVLLGIAFQELSCIFRSYRKNILYPLSLSLVGLYMTSSVTESAARGIGDYANRVRAEGMVVLHGDTQVTLFEPGVDSWYYANLGWLRKRTMGAVTPVAVCYDPCFCGTTPDVKGVRYASGALEDFTPSTSHCVPAAVEPLSAKIIYNSMKGTLEWSLGPQRSGRWYYAMSPGFSRSALPAMGRRPYLLKQKVSLVITFESEDGWTTTSAELFLDPEKIDEQGVLNLFWERQ